MSRSLSFYPDPTYDINGFARLLSHKLDALTIDAPRYTRDNTSRSNALRQLLLGDQGEQCTSWRSPHSDDTHLGTLPVDILQEGKEHFVLWKRACADVLAGKEGEANVRRATELMKEKLLRRASQDSTLHEVLTAGQAYRPPRQDQPPACVPTAPTQTYQWSAGDNCQNRRYGAPAAVRRDPRAPFMQHPMERTNSKWDGGRRRGGVRIVGHGGEGIVSSLLFSGGLGARVVPVA
ncbi:hypothetical protein FRB95_001368 [Tulasnella sp. JGI-2019a]|nr:hypothetical protein FRB95_001368 [Tulasnella sp. JGI-2019a]